MKRRAESISICFVAMLIVLTCLFMPLIGQSGAWFSAELNNLVYIDLQISSMNIKVYQNVVSDTNEKLPLDEIEGDRDYIDLGDRMIVPDEDVPLVLFMQDVDSGTEKIYIRCRLELINNQTNEAIPIEINGYAPSSKTEAGFNLIDGWLRYQKNGQDVVFDSADPVCLLTSFKIYYNDFKVLNGSETVKFVLTIQSADTPSAFES